VIRCQNWVVCYELAFAAEIVAPAAKQLSLLNLLPTAKQLPNWAACSEPVLAAEVGCLQRTSSRCQFLQ
jgi:hypothetical protein